jgi:integrase
MSVHTLPDGRIIVKHPRGYPTAKKYFGRGEDARLAAEAYDAAVKARGACDVVSFAAIAEAYCESLRARCRPSTVENAISKFSSVIVPHFADTMVSGITHAALDRYVMARQATCKNSTIRTELGLIHAALNYAQKTRVIVTNLAKGHRPPRDDTERIRPPSEAEFVAILGQASPALQRLLLVGWYTGIRVGPVEAYGLRWDQVDFDAQILTVKSAQKGGAPYRAVPIVAPLFDLMQEWVQDGCPLIIHRDGKPIRTIEKAWTSAKRRAGVTRRMRLYDLRHSAATRMVAGGAPITVVASILGHSAEMCARTYAHHDARMQREAVKCLGTLPSTQSEK